MGPGGMEDSTVPLFQSMGVVMGRMSVGMYEFLRGVRPEGSGIHCITSTPIYISQNRKLIVIHLVPSVSRPVLTVESNHCTEGEA